MSVKSDAAVEVRKVVESVKAHLSGTGGKLGEADTRAWFIDPLLRALGYKAIGDLQHEFYVKDTKEYLDYMLLVNGKPRIAVEAKALGKNLTDGDAGQVIQYCSILGIEWAVVTNVREWRLYHQFAQADLAGKLLFNLDLVGWSTKDEFDALFDQLWLVSKEAFEGSGGPQAWLRAQRLDAALRDGLTNAGSLEVKYLRKRLHDQKVEVGAEDIASWFKGKLLEPLPIPAAAPPAEVPPTPVAAVAMAGVAETSGPGATKSHWMVPASGHSGVTAEQSLHNWLDSGKWGFWESTPGRKSIHAGDLMAFYAAGTGVVAYAEVTGDANLLVAPDEWPEPVPQDKPVYKVPLKDVKWLPSPNKIDAQLRSSLDAFTGRDVNGVWFWLVQTTRRLSAHDFLRLTGQ
ncbi:MAG: type I restriction enzyme HsdR N-terminal domain-containing protein [Chloroflexi bacterium]|nr:type I restriction enzyme HsdR N-terminal domain-containing protein [Chloroflexota bacterium]